MNNKGMVTFAKSEIANLERDLRKRYYELSELEDKPSFARDFLNEEIRALSKEIDYHQTVIGTYEWSIN